MGGNHRITWEKATPIRRPDNLCATTFTQKAFIPSYQKLPYGRPDMHYIVTMEYRRMWFEEREAWQKEAYPKIKKGLVLRVLERSKKQQKTDKTDKKGPKDDTRGDTKTPAKLKSINKRFKNIQSKLDTGRSSLEKLKEKRREGGNSGQNAGQSRQESLSQNVPENVTQIKQESLTQNTPEDLTKIKQESLSKKEQKSMNPSRLGSSDQDRSGHSGAEKPQSSELVPQCARCGTFHAQNTRCPTAALCKNEEFQRKILRDKC